MDMMFNTEMIVKDMKRGKEDMTEKRFWILNTLTEYSGIKDKDKLLTFDEVADLLSELLEGKKKLHIQCDLLQEQVNEYHRVARENVNRVEQLKRENKKLKDENEQLKQHNTELINKIDFLERIIDGDVE